MDNLSKCSTNNDRLPKNPLLYLFVQCAWHPNHGPCYNGLKYRKLENKLETVSFDEIEYATYRDSNGHLCILRKPENGTPYEDFQRKTEDERDLAVLTHLAYELNVTIEHLNKANEDVNYKGFAGNTVLNYFLIACQNIAEHAPEGEISKTRKMMKSLIKMKAPICAKTLSIASACKNRQILQTIISSLADAEIKNTALHVIVDKCVDEKGNYKCGYANFVRYLVRKGANVNAKDSEGVTPVHLAAEKFHLELLEFFADNGADFQQRTNRDQTPLHFACKSKLKLENPSKSMETIDFLLSKGCDAKAADADGFTPLHFAAEIHDVQIVNKLIALGVNVDCQTAKTLLTPLYLAAKSDKLDNMKALVKAGADVNAEAADGSTPIFMSTMLGSYKSMKFLMDKGADLHRRERLMGFTLLHIAANGAELRPQYGISDDIQEVRKRKLKKLRMLINKGFDVNDAGNCGVTPLQLVTLAPDDDAVKLLLKHGADVNFQNQWTALHLALLIRNLKIVKILVANGSDVNCRGGPDHWTPLHLVLKDDFPFTLGVYPETTGDDVGLSCPIKKLWACEKRRVAAPQDLEVMKILIDNGADVKARDVLGETPLHLVTRHASNKVQKLLNAGAEVNVQDNKGRLAWHASCMGELYGNEPLWQLFLDHGADVNDDEASRMIVKSPTKFKNAAVEHTIKRKLVGLPIAGVYESLIHEPEFASFYELCYEEATKLMKHRDDTGFSLYEFLKMNAKLQYHFIEKISDSYGNLEELFPLYAGLIRGVCRESAIRRQLLESARVAWVEITGIRLPEVCFEHIFSFLSNRYLNMFTVAVEKFTSVEEKNVVFTFAEKERSAYKNFTMVYL